MQKHLDDLKIEFVLSVYESIQNQIRHADIKVSLILSWVSITAVMLGREVSNMVVNKNYNVFSFIFIFIVLVTLGMSGAFIFGTLKPRMRRSKGKEFTGLLYTGDILRLGKEAPDRMVSYLTNLGKISSPEEINAQFVNSIVSISEIVEIKNKMFLRALASTAVSFAFLVLTIALNGVKTANF